MLLSYVFFHFCKLYHWVRNEKIHNLTTFWNISLTKKWRNCCVQKYNDFAKWTFHHLEMSVFLQHYIFSICTWHGLNILQNHYKLDWSMCHSCSTKRKYLDGVFFILLYFKDNMIPQFCNFEWLSYNSKSWHNSVCRTTLVSPLTIPIM